MYEIIKETIKVMEHIWDFYPEACAVEKDFEEPINTVNISYGKKMYAKKVENLLLPKILVNDVDASTLPTKNVKKNNFFLLKNTTTHTKQNKKYELSNSDAISFVKKDIKNDEFDFLSLDSTKSSLRSRIRNLNGISEKYASCQNSNRKISKSCNSSKSFRISNYKPNIMRSADINASRKEKSRNPFKKAPLFNKQIN